MIRRLHSALTAAALAAAFLTACGDDGITLPDERAAAAIEIQDGDDQTGAVGSALPNPVSALVTDADGNPVSIAIIPDVESTRAFAMRRRRSQLFTAAVPFGG